MFINCDTCVMRDIACQDCFVTSLLAPHEDVSQRTVEAIELLSSRGIVRPIRFERVLQG
jgi:microcystin degradation protein MlrC